jgi:RIO-like serine/threonine protein kinase
MRSREMATLTLKKYLFRERVVRVILEEWRKSKEWISLMSISRKYNLPYFNTRNFLVRLAKDNVITWYKDPYRIKTPSGFKLTPDGEKKLRIELLYASAVQL